MSRSQNRSCLLSDVVVADGFAELLDIKREIGGIRKLVLMWLDHRLGFLRDVNADPDVYKLAVREHRSWRKLRRHDL